MIHQVTKHHPHGALDQTPQFDADYWAGLHHLTHLLGGEWTPAILAALTNGHHHFTDILTTVHTTNTGQPDPTRRLHDSILGRTLRKLEQNGLVIRHEVAGTFPKCTAYELAPWTAELLNKLRPAVRQTATRFASGIDEGQARFDRAEDAMLPTAV